MTEEKVFCLLCECYHRKDQRVLCSFYKALNRVLGKYWWDPSL